MPRFPTRTLVLMTLTLVAFAWFWWQTHALAAKAAPGGPPGIRLVALPDAGNH